MVWIHGGAFVSGESSDYDPTALVEDGVIVVTINYRLGALGFLAHPALADARGQSGDYGLIDQQAALRWVQRNIAGFGGNPHNVTIFGVHRPRRGPGSELARRGPTARRRLAAAHRPASVSRFTSLYTVLRGVLKRRASSVKVYSSSEGSPLMAVSFAQDIRPLFTDTDIAHMKNYGVALDDFGYMRDPAHAQKVLDAVSTGAMPPGSSGEPAWSPDTVQILRDWIAGGYQA